MDWLQHSWKLLVARGVAGIAFGVIAMVWPISTVFALVVVFGAWALVDGAGAIAAALRGGDRTSRVAFGLLGLVSVVAALIALVRPIETAEALTWILGVWLVFRGGVELAATLMGRRDGSRPLGLLAAALSVLAGALFAANPGRGAVSLAWVIGLTAFLWGVVFLVSGLLVRRSAAEVAAGQAATPHGLTGGAAARLRPPAAPGAAAAQPKGRRG